MAVQQLTSGKVIIKKDGVIQHPIEVESIGEHTNIYDRPYTTRSDNIDVSELAELLAGKLNFSIPSIVKKTAAVDIDIKREIAIGTVDKNAVKSEVITGKVNNKVEKLKALRRRNNGS